MSVFEIIRLMQSVAVALSLAVALGGILSALVYLGWFETMGRRHLQARLLKEFFGSNWKVLLERDRLFESEDSFQLHYRQVCGQLLSRVNEEAVSEREYDGSVTQCLIVTNGAIAVDLPAEERMNLALRAIDKLQMRLATTTSDRVMRLVTLAWFLIYSIALFATWFLGDLNVAYVAAVSVFAKVVLVIITIFLILMISVIVALGTGAVAVVVFSVADRLISAR